MGFVVPYGQYATNRLLAKRKTMVRLLQLREDSTEWDIVNRALGL